MIHLNSNTLALCYGNNYEVVKFGNVLEELQALPQKAYNLLDSLSRPENLDKLDADVATPYSVSLFVELERKKLDSLSGLIQKEMLDVYPLQEKVEEIFFEIDDFIQSVYNYGNLSKNQSEDKTYKNIPSEDIYEF